MIKYNFTYYGTRSTNVNSFIKLYKMYKGINEIDTASWIRFVRSHNGYK